MPRKEAVRGASGAASSAWTARGLIAVAMLAGLAPSLLLQSLIPVLKNGLDVWLASLLPVVGVSGLVGGLVAVSYLRPHRVISGLLQGLGWLVVAGYVAGVGLDLLLMAGAVRKASPDLGFVNVVNIVEWLAISPLVWLTLRMLRVKPT